VADAKAFFNFVVGKWQPLNLATGGAYASARQVLYVAFTREKGRPALFVKLGFRELADGWSGQNSLVGYLEKKSRKLRLTNAPGAGIFIFPVPESHKAFGQPGRAAEASLKTALLHNSGLVVMPSGHLAEVGTFSASLEYLFVEARAAGPGADACAASAYALAALARALREFSGDAHLMPRRAEASGGGGARRGRKRLRPWGESLENDGGAAAEACGGDDCGGASAAGALRTRARARLRRAGGS